MPEEQLVGELTDAVSVSNTEVVSFKYNQVLL